MKPGRRREPRQERSRALVAAIVEAATQLFSEKDKPIPSMKAIARRAGVGIGSVYEYFTESDGVIDAIVDRLADINAERFKRILESTEDKEIGVVFRALIDEGFAVYLDAPQLSRLSIKAVARFDRIAPLIKERDAFSSIIADRICKEYPYVDHKQAERMALSSVEMLSGILLGELYRDDNNERRTAMRAAIIRTVDAEMEFLKSLSSQSD